MELGMPKRGTGILYVTQDDDDRNLQDVPIRNVSKHLRQRYWIKRWSFKRWPITDFVHATGHMELPLTSLGRKPDDPGDAFVRLFLVTSKFSVDVRTWVEVTEVYFPGQAQKVDAFIRQHNELPGKGKIDASEFLQSLDLGPPDALLQHDMADHVIAAVVKKAKKGREGGSYRPLVEDYGRGALIVGLPLWFATLPSEPENLSNARNDFWTRLALGFEAIEGLVLRKDWCPFDSVVVLWTPTPEALHAWANAADPHFYSDPGNVALHQPVSPLQAHSFLEGIDKTAGELDVSVPDFLAHARWDRYASLDAMLADQRRRFRFFNAPRPLGPKACLEVSDTKDRSTWKLHILVWISRIWLFVRRHGWRGLQRWILVRFSPKRIYSRWRIRRRVKGLYTPTWEDEVAS